MIGIMVAAFIILGAVLMVYASGIDVVGLFTGKKKELNETRHSRCNNPLKNAPIRCNKNRLRAHDPPDTFFSNLDEDVMEHLIMYWEMTHATVDHIDYDGGFVVMNDGTMITQDGKVLPPNGQEFYQTGFYTDEERRATEQAAPETILNYPYEERLGGNLIRTPNGDVVPWMPEVPAPIYGEAETPARNYDRSEDVPVQHTNHHSYTPHTPSESPVHVETPVHHHVETPSYHHTPDPTPSWTPDPSPSPSYSDPSPSPSSE